MTTTLDTSGEVDLTVADGIPAEIAGGHRWSDLSPFTQGYIEALFADGVDEVEPGRHFMLGRPVGFSDLAPETLARIIADCEAFAAGGLNGGAGYTADTGKTFWLARQKGLWVTIGLPPLTVQLGDDGKVRFTTPARPENPDQGENS